MEQPVCMQCRKAMSCKRNGVFVVAPNDLTHATAGDIFQCKECGQEVVSNFAVAETQIHIDVIPKEFIVMLDT